MPQGRNDLKYLLFGQRLGVFCATEWLNLNDPQCSEAELGDVETP